MTLDNADGTELDIRDSIVAALHDFGKDFTLSKLSLQVGNEG